MEVIFISITDILASEFAKTIKPNNRSTNETIVYGTIIKDSESTSVQIDGSETRTPISTTTDVEDRERVTVLIKDHQAIVTGNTSSPSARNGTVQAIDARVENAEEILELNNNQLQTLAVNYLKVNETLIANTGRIEKLEGDFISYEKAVFEELEATNARIDNITSTEITTEYLEANYATINELKATNATVDVLSTNVGKIDTLIFGSASGNTIQTQFSNSVIAQLGDAQIKSTMIQDVSASKISAGTIYTNDVTIQSKNGQMMLKDNTIQISDGTITRVQIGKDASDDYSINIWDKDGKLMFSKGGITDAAIKNAIIRNDMVSENANIHAGKLDISSLFTEINNSSETIKANKIYLDEQKQTLEVSFKSMTTTVSGLKQTQTSQGIQLEALNGKISSKIWEQDITTAIDNVNLGGTNLLPDTNVNTLAAVSGIVNRYWSDTAVSENISCEFIELTDPPVKGLKYGVRHSCTVITNSGRNLTWRSAEKIEMEDGEDYTLSVYARVVSGDSATLRFRFYGTGYQSKNIVIDNTEWKRISVTIKVDKTKFTDDGYCNIGCGGLVGTTISTVELCGFKLEKGNKATDWTPAPQDTEVGIDALSTKYSTLEQDVNSFKTTVSETYTTLNKFNNLSIGGTNLLRDTKTMDIKNGFVKYSATIIIQDDGDGYFVATLPADSKWDNINFYFPNNINEIVGKEITLSFDAKSNGLTLSTIQWIISAAIFDKNNTRLKNKQIAYMNDGSKFNTSDYIDGEWVRCYITFVFPTIEEMSTITEGELYRCALQFYSGTENDTHALQIRKIKCEFGNKATDYSPSPYDTEASVTELTTKYSTLEQDVNSFKTTVSETYTTLDAFNNLSVGGRNLLLNSKSFSKTTSQNQTNQALNIGTFSDYFMSERAVGKQITVSFDWATTATSGKFQIMFNNTPWATIFPNSTITISSSNKSGRVEYTATLTDIAVNSSATYTGLRIRIDNIEGTTTVSNVKCEFGNKATDWTAAPEDMETVITSVQTVATQTANKFNWLVKSGTSATDFTLTDRMAELTADIISLNGNVKVDGTMIVDGAITSNKIAIGDFTNLVDVNPDTYNPRNYTIVTDDNGLKWFKFGSDTTLGYYSVYMNYLPPNTIFNKGDKYLFRALVKASMVTSVGFRLRVFYSDGASPTYTNMASTFIDNVPTEQEYIQISFTVDTLPTPGRPIKNIGVFLETRNTKLGTIYVRELTVHRMMNNVLIADGAITADKIDVADLFTQDIVATGSIISPLLKSSDYKYDGATATGAEYSTTGMIVDLQNKLIRTPKFCIKADGTACLENGIFSGKVTAESGEISGNLAFGTSGSITHTNGDYTVTLRGVRTNAAYGVFYITDNSGDNPIYPFMLSGDGSLRATKATVTGNITANEGSIGPITIQKNQGLYYSPAETSGFGLWATTAHANIAFHAGANNTNIGGAPFRIYHNGDVVAKNIDVQGGKIGYWSVDADGVLAGTSGEMRMELYPKGKTYNISSNTSATFFLVIYESGGAVPIGGITRSGWKNIT